MTLDKEQPTSTTSTIVNTEDENKEVVITMTSKPDYEVSESTETDNSHD